MTEVEKRYQPLHKNTVDITGEHFGEWEVLGYLGKSYWECRCSCGEIKAVDGRSLRKGQTLSCGHETKKLQDLTGKQFGEWEVINHAFERNRRHYWKVKCSCGKEGLLDSFSLTSGHSKSCGHDKLIDIKGQEFGTLTAIEYLGKGIWLCKCSCGAYKEVDGKLLRNGSTTSCGDAIHKIIDITGQQFGDLTAIKYLGKTKWECKCSCGKICVVEGRELRSGARTDCGHSSERAFQDLTDKKFGLWKVIKYKGNRKWECKCECGSIRNVDTQSLLMGSSTSCGCNKYNKARDTLLSRYGDIATSRVQSPREGWQLEVIYSKENMEVYLNNFECMPTIAELSQILDTSTTVLLKKIHLYELEHLVNIKPFYSQLESELLEYIKPLTDKEIVSNDRSILSRNRELDILIPDLKIAIEFNGVYWHSSKVKDKKYHQIKTLDCMRKGIRLIHIFDYEWGVKETQIKIKRYLKDILCEPSIKIGARKCLIQEISGNEAMKFEEEYHINGSSTASINLALTYNNEIIAVMTFGKPRFNRDFEYELIRYCCRSGVAILGGAEKLFKYFIKNYNPQSIVCYTDISKFTGNVYTRLGFKCTKDSLTEPNYVWTDIHFNNILRRYQTQKHKLLNLGLGSEEETEDEIMERLGYYKIYDSGNLRLTWYK